MNIKKLKKILELHKLWLESEEKNGKRADLSDTNLSGADLSHADLSHANLSDTNLSGANLSGTNLFRANLSGVNLSEANLSEADLSGSYPSKANLYKANLYKANLVKADLSESCLLETNLSGTNLLGANLAHTVVKGFYINNYFGFAWKNKDDKVIVKIGCLEYQLEDWIKNHKKYRIKGYSDIDVKEMLIMLKALKAMFKLRK